MQLYNPIFGKFHEKVLAVLRTWRSRSVRTVCAANPVRNSIARNNRLQKKQISRKTRGNRRPATTPEFSNGVKY